MNSEMIHEIDGGLVVPIEGFGVVGKRVTAALAAGTPHRLRHTFATAAYRSRHDLLAVQQLLGHSSVATTMGYVGLDDDALRRSVDAASLAATP